MSEINLIKNTDFNDFQFNFEEKKNINQNNILNTNKIIQQQKNKNEFNNINDIVSDDNK